MAPHASNRSNRTSGSTAVGITRSLPTAAADRGRQRGDVVGDQLGDRRRAVRGGHRLVPRHGRSPTTGPSSGCGYTARAFGIEWPADDEASASSSGRSTRQRSKGLGALLMAIRRAGGGASYVPFSQGQRPWHSAVAATYAHGTAPLRRLADRYVVMAALAVANGQAVPDQVSAAFAQTSRRDAPSRRDGRARSSERSSTWPRSPCSARRRSARSTAVVTDVDDRGARIQLCNLPVVSRVAAESRRARRRDPRARRVDRHPRPYGEARTGRLIEPPSPGRLPWNGVDRAVAGRRRTVRRPGLR